MNITEPALTFSGKESAHMRFNVEAEPQEDFNKWVDSVKKSGHELTEAGYKELSKRSKSEEQTFSAYPPNLFDSVVDKNGGHYMKDMGDMKEHSQSNDSSQNMTNMDGMEDMDGTSHDMSSMDHK